MKLKRKKLASLATALITLILLAGSANGDFIIIASDDGSDLTFSFSGELDLTGLNGSTESFNFEGVTRNSTSGDMESLGSVSGSAFKEDFVLVRGAGIQLLKVFRIIQLQEQEQRSQYLIIR